MNKYLLTIRTFVLSLVFTIPQIALAQEAIEETTGGITLTEGVFYPTYSIEGMVYNSETKSYQMPTDSNQGGSGGQLQTNSLPDPAPLLNEYNSYTTIEAKKAYFAGLLSPQKASLFGELNSEEQDQMIDSFTFDTTNQTAFDTAKNSLRGFLEQLPAGEVGPALNMLDPYTGRVYIGAPSYYGSKTYGPLEAIDLSGLNLAGLDTTNKSLAQTNFVGSTITAEQLNGAYVAQPTHNNGMNSALYGVNLSGLNLIGLDLANKWLGSINLANSNITANQINSAGNINNSNLSGLNLLGMNTASKDLGGINFTNANITTEQLNASTSYANAVLTGIDLTGLNTTGKSLWGVNFVGTNITVDQLNASNDIGSSNLSGRDLTNLNMTGKTLSGINLQNTNITPEQLVTASTWTANYYTSSPHYWPNLKGTGITKEALTAALAAAGKTGTWGFDPNLVHYD